MTTPQAAAQYLAEHQQDMYGRKTVVYNPNGCEVETLPIIYGFNNGGSRGWLEAVAIAEDGKVLGGHSCSDEGYMLGDLGILVGTRDDRHENDYQPHYPNGYRMQWVSSAEISKHEKLLAAIEIAKSTKQENPDAQC